MNKYSSTSKLIICALFTALTAVGAYLSLPLPFTPVPVTLATLAAMLSGALLGSKYGSISQLVYIFIGAIGVPVFHNFTAGLGIITGPTGGYLIGYVVIAFCAGLYSKTSRPESSNLSSTLKLILFLTVGNILCYAAGTLWFVISTDSSVVAALLSCIVPFIPGDILKILVAAFLTKRLQAAMQKNFS